MSRQTQKDKRKDIQIDKMRQKKQEEMQGKPMNKYINDDKFVMPNTLRKFWMDNSEPVRDVMRQVQAFVHQVRHQKLIIKGYKIQYESGEIKELNKYGQPMSKEELYSQIIVEQVNVPRTMADIRKLILNKLLPMIDDIFTPSMCDKFIVNIVKVLKEIDEDLFPEKMELLEIR